MERVGTSRYLFNVDEEIKFNPFKDIDDPDPIPRVSKTPLDSFDSSLDSFDTAFTNPLFELDSEYTLNFENLIFDIQNEDSNASETETIMDAMQIHSFQNTSQIPPLFEALIPDRTMHDIILYRIRHGMVHSSCLSFYLGLLFLEEVSKSQSLDSFELGDKNVVLDPVIIVIKGWIKHYYGGDITAIDLWMWLFLYESVVVSVLTNLLKKKTEMKPHIVLSSVSNLTHRAESKIQKCLAQECLYVNFLLEIEPKKLIEALEEKGWVLAMTEELNQIERNKDLLRACPHHSFTELHQLDTFYNGLNPSDQDSLNSAADGNLLKRIAQDVLKIIENKSKVHTSRNKPIVSQVKASNVDSSEIASAVSSAVTSAMTAMFKQHQVTPAPASVKAIEESCVTCGGAHSYRQCPATDSNTFSGYQDNIQGKT
ncbi:hypothetical protein Tco_0934457 [Tanacetum coccineum]